MENFSAAKDWILTFVISGFATYVGVQMRELVKSVSELNVRVAEILANLANHKERLDEHSARIYKLEDRI